MDYSVYYESIAKPFFAPEPWVFGLAWGVIYPLIAIAGFYLIYKLAKKEAPMSMLWLFAINMAANLAFTPIQLSLQSTALATLDIYIVLVSLIFFMRLAWRHLKPVFWLMLPYLLWGSFATILQTTILIIN